MTIVRPRRPVKLAPIRLSINDLLAPECHLCFVYYYERPSGETAAAWDDAMSTPKLQAALQGLLDVYPVAGGTLCRVEGSADREIPLDSESDPNFGIPFQEAKTTIDFASLAARGFKATDAEEAELVPVGAVDLFGHPRPPLFLVKLTRFPCSSICIAVAWHHAGSDARGIVDAIDAWGQIARGCEPSKPELDRQSILRPSPGLEALPIPVKEGGEASFELAVTVTQRVALGSEKRHLLKEYARRGSATPAGVGGGISTSDIVTALLWRAVARSRHAPPFPDDGLLECGFALNMRKKPRIGLAPGVYYGNAGLLLVSRLSYADLTRNLSLVEVAHIVHRSLHEVDRAFAQRAVDFSYQHLGHFWHTLGMDGPPRAPQIIVTNLRKFPFYELDFGAGKPTYAGAPHWASANGIALVLPAKGGHTEDMVVHFMLTEEGRARLSADEELLRYAELLR